MFQFDISCYRNEEKVVTVNSYGKGLQVILFEVQSVMGYWLAELCKI